MKLRSVLLALALSLSVLLILAYANTSKSTPCSFGWGYPACLLTLMETLSGALIGTAGAIFAAWLAWSSVQPQLRSASLQSALALRSVHAERIRIVEQRIALFQKTFNAFNHKIGPDMETVEVGEKGFSEWAWNEWQRTDQLLDFITARAAEKLEGDSGALKWTDVVTATTELRDILYSVNISIHRDQADEELGPITEAEQKELDKEESEAGKKLPSAVAKVAATTAALISECNKDLERYRVSLNSIQKQIDKAETNQL